jgi:hypothetical protein
MDVKLTLALREAHRQAENITTEDDVLGENCTRSFVTLPVINRMIKSRRISWAGYGQEEECIYLLYWWESQKEINTRKTKYAGG